MDGPGAFFPPIRQKKVKGWDTAAAHASLNNKNPPEGGGTPW
jgi:hypothetical protein